MQIDPAQLEVSERYKLLIGGVVPRPIAFVSTHAANGALNLAPFSFFAGVASEPMSLLFCPANRNDGGEKDTLRNIDATKEFVVNVVSKRIGRAMAACAEDLAYGDSEFDLAGLTPSPSAVVSPPRVSEALLSYECRLMQIIRLAPGAPSGGNIVIGQVVSVHAADDIIDDACRIDPQRLDAVGRMAGLTYCTTRDRFDLPWGRHALES